MGMLALAGTLAIAPSLYAADTPPATTETKPAVRVASGEKEKMMADLNLTADQQKQMKDARKEMSTKAKALKNDTSLTDEQRKAKTKALRDEFNTKVKGFLNPEQFAKWEKMNQPRGPKQGGQKAGGQKPAQ